MPAVFYKKFWHMIGPKVTEEVLKVLNGAPIPDSWNDTTVVLIDPARSFKRLRNKVASFVRFG